ncbi:IS256 family transposase [Aeromonas veronii]|uniref:IS256 family transposase n=1 Tax=Aeromonas veronii TaxID=654 RepID=UPI001117448D|nr:IS256 family transposase [Aeromonas veronii]TNI00551.1 IS256 family transposase [Aeromonas veronii]HDO1314153.1 IS256 family transposase [Aeromonas veronii]HDO1321811.1 IS256 family transposase [Aeromonas veronii]
MDQDKLKALAAELAKDIKSEKDLGTLTQQLIKLTVETALNAEMDEYLGYQEHAPQGRWTGNNRNSYSTKRLKGLHGEVTIQAPRDRNSSFEPQFVRKGQSRLTQMDEQILALYAKGVSTRDIVDAFKEMYDADISAGLVSKVTERVIEQVHEWQNRPLDPLYPIVYLDSIVLKIRANQRVINKSLYLALGINMEGHKELLGLLLAETEGAKFWLSVLTELKNRGLEDILIACVDGLKGFPDAIAVEYPQTKVQLCIVHMVRNSQRYVSWKDYKAVKAELKQIYQSATEREAQQALAAFGERWDSQYPQITRSWQSNWANLITLFDYPPAIRKVIYTTNAIESLNSVRRKTTKQRKLFPTDDSALKVAFLAIQQASKKWTMPIQNWKLALNRFIIEFGDRLNGHL